MKQIAQLCEGCLDFEKRDMQILVVLNQTADRIEGMLRAASQFIDFDPKTVRYPLFSDPFGRVGALYGLAYQFHFHGRKENNEPSASHRPATFLIDKQGVIRFERRCKTVTDRPSPVQLLAILDQIEGNGVANVPANAPTEKPQPPEGALKRCVNPVDSAEMVYVLAGKVRMGSNSVGHYGLGQPEHEQEVEGCWMYTMEVTNRQYRKFLEANPQWSPERIERQLHDGNYLAHWRHLSGDDQPVVCVSWHAAQAYAQWAGGRLPSEPEWEYVARAGKAGKRFDYATADGKISSKLAHFKAQSSTGGLKEKNGPIPAGSKPVGQFPPNPLGLYDLAGNVWEWCQTPMRKYPYSAKDLREQPDADEPHVVRGGSWITDSTWLRSATRAGCHARVCDSDLGFRCILPANVE